MRELKKYKPKKETKEERDKRLLKDIRSYLKISIPIIAILFSLLRV